MSRRAQAPKRIILPDPVYGSETLSKFMNMVMESGKKSVAEQIVYGAIGQIADRRKLPAENAVEILEQALENVKPMVEVKSRRVGGATYQVPMEVRPRRATTLAIRWLVSFARDRRERTMAERLANELLDAGNGIGAAMKRKDDLHKMAESNKAFAHYRW
jgi:small subunit ribosomal protein S7